VVKLGTLALKTMCKPIANRLKKEAGKHPKFRQFIISFAQVYPLLVL
jgi:optic atrophy 3 protein